MRRNDTSAYVALMERWVAELVTENPIVTNVERDHEVDRWYVRVRGEEKVVTTVWFTVGEHTLHVESYFMPWPEENVAETFEYLLRASTRFHGLRVVIGPEDALYFRGEIPLTQLSQPSTNSTEPGSVATNTESFPELDRVLGAIYAHSESCFRTAMSMGFASRFT